MTFKTAVDNLVRTYEKYGFSRSEIESQMKDGIMNQGFSVSMSYNGLRLALAHVTGEHEYFSIEDMMEITGESREEVLKQVEDMRSAAVAAGENPDDYAVPVERKILYFPVRRPLSVSRNRFQSRNTTGKFRLTPTANPSSALRKFLPGIIRFTA